MRHPLHPTPHARAVCSALALALAAACTPSEASPAQDLGLPPREAPPTPEELCAEVLTTDARFFEGEQGEELRARVEALEEHGSPARRLEALVEYARWLGRFGRSEEAIAVLEEALALAEPMRSDEIEAYVRLHLGVAHLRDGEVEHCIDHHNPARCIYPIDDEGVWTDPEPAERAIEQFEEILEEPLSVEDEAPARWLLHVARLAIGEEEPPVPSAATAAVPRFEDVAPSLGIDVLDLAGGALLEDVDGDGWLDVVTTTLDPCGPMRYFRGDGRGGFVDWTERAGLVGQLGGINLVQADYDGDGLLDLLVLRGAWMGPVHGAQANSLLRQRPDGTFADVGFASGVGARAYPTITAAWQDYDLDGDLDLAVANEEGLDELLRNRGDGTFENVSGVAGVLVPGPTKGIAWGDYDDDGDPDLYLSIRGEPNRLYRNEGDGTFVEVARELGVAVDQDASRTFATWFFDYDNDGRLDLFVAGYDANLEGYVLAREGRETRGEPLHLFRNLGGTFEDVSERTRMDRVSLPMGANYGDVDNDGWLDVYLGTGRPSYEYLVPNLLLVNAGGERFHDASTASGLGHLQKGHGIAFGDVDNDGDQDVLAQMGGFYPADAFHNAFFENPGTENRWVTLLLRSGSANRFAVGARVRIDVVRSDGTPRSLHHVVGSGGSFGASSLQLEAGLGDAVRIERVVVRWPAGEEEVFEDVPLDASVRLVEGSGRADRLERPPVDLAD